MKPCSSDPDSPNYGQHWSSRRVIDKFAPAAETVDAVRAWLVSSGIASEQITHSDNKGWLAFDVTASQAEELLYAEFHEWEDVKTRKTSVCCEKYVFC